MASTDDDNKKPLRKKKRRPGEKPRKRKRPKNLSDSDQQVATADSDRDKQALRKRKKKKKRRKKIAMESGENTATKKKSSKKSREDVPVLGEDELVGRSRKKSRKKSSSHRKSSSSKSTPKDIQTALVEEEKQSRPKDKRDKRGASTKSKRTRDRKGSERVAKGGDEGGSTSSRSKRFASQPTKVNPKTVALMYGTPLILIILIALGIYFKGNSPPPKARINEKVEQKQARDLATEADKWRRKFVSSHIKKDAQRAVDLYSQAYKIFETMKNRRKGPNGKNFPRIDINDEMQNIQQNMHDVQKAMNW